MSIQLPLVEIAVACLILIALSLMIDAFVRLLEYGRRYPKSDRMPSPAKTTAVEAPRPAPDPAPDLETATIAQVEAMLQGPPAGPTQPSPPQHDDIASLLGPMDPEEEAVVREYLDEPKVAQPTVEPARRAKPKKRKRLARSRKVAMANA